MTVPSPDAGTDQGPESTQQQSDSQQSPPNDGQSGHGQQSESTDKGFPDNTPVAQMTAEQQAAYYKHQNRKAEGRLGQFKGVTPEQIQQMLSENESLKNEKLTADQKAVKEAEKAARAAADAEWRPKLQAQQLKAIAGSVLKGDQLNAWLAGMNPSAFANDSGDIDEEKVMGHLTAAFGVGDSQQQSNGGRQQPPAWGQQSGGIGVPVRPGEAGRAALAKRHGVQTP